MNLSTQPIFDLETRAFVLPEERVDIIYDGQPGTYPVDAMECVTGGHENENETCFWVEYRIGDVVVHRSAHVDLKEGLDSLARQALFA